MGWLVRTRLTFMCVVALLFALLSISGETVSAQSSSTAPAEEQKPSSLADMPVVSSKAPNSQDSARQFSKALQIAAKRGRRSHLPDYIASGLGLPNGTMQPMWASVVDIDGGRTIYLPDGTDAAVVITAVGERTMAYLVRAGVLKKAVQIKSGGGGSKSLQNVPIGSAVENFNAERDLWIEQLVAKFPAASPSK